MLDIALPYHQAHYSLRVHTHKKFEIDEKSKCCSFQRKIMHHYLETKLCGVQLPHGCT
jgi:hypothetical protein